MNNTQLSRLLNLRLPLVLASGSPRRQLLLSRLGFEFTVVPAEIDENSHDQSLQPEDYSMSLALRKAKSVTRNIDFPALVLGADTIVLLDGEILNKPVSTSDAARMLRMLSGATHTVYTGIALVESPSMRFTTNYQKTDVTFRHLTNDEIESYIATGSPLDKAGSYGIQDDFGAVFVSRIEGCYYNIVGLPLEMLYRTISEFNISK